MKTPVRVPAATGVVNLCEVASHLLKTMPVNAATKHAVRVVLRSAVNKSCPDYRGNDNKKNVRFISNGAARKDAKAVVADHAIPLSLLLDEVYRKEIKETAALVDLVKLYSVMALLTKEKDALLRKRGLAKRMPEGWDGADVLARYRAVGISVLPVEGGSSERDARADV